MPKMGKTPQYTVVWSGGMERRGECAPLTGDGLERIGPLIDHAPTPRPGRPQETEVGRLLRSRVKDVPIGTGSAKERF